MVQMKFLSAGAKTFSVLYYAVLFNCMCLMLHAESSFHKNWHQTVRKSSQLYSIKLVKFHRNVKKILAGERLSLQLYHEDHAEFISRYFEQIDNGIVRIYGIELRSRSMLLRACTH